MSNAIFDIPHPINEPVLSYAPGSAEKSDLEAALKALKATKIDAPMWIGGKKVTTNSKVAMHPPHEISHVLGHFNMGDKSHVTDAINAALDAKSDWEAMPYQDRAAIFLKAADLIVGPYRAKMNAATMLAQSKNAYQAEIDAVCEMADFFRFNAKFAEDLYIQQPYSPEGIWNRLEYRALEGFVFAITPFNFTSIAANLPAAPALMGNTVVWKPSETQIYSAQVIMEVFEEAGLPAGVINLIYVDGPAAGEVVFSHRDFAGLHFTGSTGVFRHLWKTISNNLDKYRSYPRIVGETGGKDFIVAHESADAKVVATALVRGAFEFQGQKCSAASRAYIPKGMWADVKKYMEDDLDDISMGTVEDFSNFVNAVIDERSFDKISAYIDQAKEDKDAEIVFGGICDKSIGYYIQPTVILAKTADYTTMCEEIFGPVLTIYIYDESDYYETLEIVDKTSPYALTGAIFAKERGVINKSANALRNAAGNFYINDKPTGAVVGQQPFGGARGSGTNDKAGSIINLYRWVSPRTIKENFNPPSNYRYPFLG